MTKNELWEHIKTHGIEHGCHASDLYIPVNDETRALIKAYDFKCNVTMFVSNTDKKLWYDIPFAYQPFWERVDRIVAGTRDNPRG